MVCRRECLPLPRSPSCLHQIHLPVPGTTPCTSLGSGTVSTNSDSLILSPSQQPLNIPGPPDCQPPFSANFLRSVVCFHCLHFLGSLSLFHWCGLAPHHPRDFPHQGQRDLRDTDMIHSLSQLISLQSSGWLTTSPFSRHFPGMALKVVPLQEVACCPCGSRF